MVRQKRNDEQDAPPISGLTLALLLAFFGMSCSLISRIHNPGDAASITAVLGIASGFVLGVPFVLGRFSAEPSLVLSSQLATILVVSARAFRPARSKAISRMRIENSGSQTAVRRWSFSWGKRTAVP